MSEREPEQRGGWAPPSGWGAPDAPAPSSPGEAPREQRDDAHRAEEVAPGDRDQPPVPAAPPGWGPPPGQEPDSQHGEAPQYAQPPRYGEPPQYGQAPQYGEAPSPPPPGWGQAPQYGQQYGQQPAPGAPAAWGAPAGWGGPAAAPRPGVVPLRPLGLGELLDGSVSVVRRYPRPTLGLSLAVALVSAVIGAVLLLLLPAGLFSTSGSADVSNAAVGGAFAGSVATYAVTALAGLVLSGIITSVVGKAVLGQPISTGQAWTSVRPRLLPLLGLALLTGLIVIAVAVAGAVVAGVAIAAAGTAGLLVAVPAVLAGLAGAVYAYVRFSLAAPALVLEKLGVREAMRRSGVLVRRSFWRVLGILLLAAVIATFVGGVLQVPFLVLGGGGGGLFSSTEGLGTTTIVLAQIGGAVARTLTAPFTSGVTALLYIDRRMRAEGLDVSLAAAAAGPRD